MLNNDFLLKLKGYRKILLIISEAFWRVMRVGALKVIHMLNRHALFSQGGGTPIHAFYTLSCYRGKNESQQSIRNILHGQLSSHYNTVQRVLSARS